MPLTKAQIVRSISKQLGFPWRRSAEMVDPLLEIIKKTLESGGDDMMLRPRKVVTFKCSGVLREKLNGKRR